MNRAYSVIDVKSMDDDQRIITGIASSISTDRMGDIVEPKGAKFSMPMPLLWQHRHDVPVGWVEFAERGDKQITFRARLARIADPGPLKDAVETAWSAVKEKLVRGVSIGFKAITHELLKDGNGIRFKEWEWLELSLVTIPANQDASIQTIRSIDAELREQSGLNDTIAELSRRLEVAEARLSETKPRLLELMPIKDFDARVAATGKGATVSSPGATGPTLPQHKENRAMTLQEQIAAFEAKRQAKAARMEELMNKAAEEGSTLDQSESEEYDTLKGEVEEVDKHLGRLADMEKLNRAKASAIEVKDVASGSNARGVFSPITVRPNVEKGTGFVRYVQSLVLGRGNLFHAAEIAKNAPWKDQTPEVELALKAAVAAGTTTDSTWAGPLYYAENLASEFIEYLRPMTILGRIPGLTRVPFNVRIPRQTGASSVGWVGETAPKPVSALSFDSITMRHAKVAGIVVISQELARFSNPNAEALIRTDLGNSIVQFTDQQFLDPDKSEVANVSPAGITNGVTPIQASGATGAALIADLADLMSVFIASNQGMGSTVWIMSSTLAMYISTIRNALDQNTFPNITADGGTLMGRPVVTSENISTGMLVLLKANEILLADDGGVTVDVSTEASLQMDGAPTDPPTSSTVFRSLWQTNEVGIRAERFINWAKRRSTAVAYIANAGYGGAPGGSGT